MRRSKEIMVLLALFIVMSVGTIWYVIDRRAKNRAPRPASAARPLTPEAPAAATPLPVNGPVELGTKETEHRTIDFSSGRPVVKDSPADKAALEAGLRDINEATKDVTFDAKKP